MKRKLPIFFLAVAVCAALLLVGVRRKIEPLIREAVNTWGPRLTKTEVRVSDVRISMLTGETTLQDFFLGSPEGFSGDRALTARSIHVDLNEASIFRNPIIIDRIEMQRPEIVYEKKAGTDNLQAILDNVKQSVGSGGGRKLVIRNFIIKEGSVVFPVSMLGGRSVRAVLPDIHLRNVGGKKGGLAPAQVFSLVLGAVYREVTSPTMANVLKYQLRAAGEGLEKAGQEVRKDLDSAAQKVIDFFSE